MIGAIGGDYPGGCKFAQPYPGMYEATVATGGPFLSICMKDWDAGMTLLGESAGYSLNTFRLSASAVPESITVSVDTVPVTAGWEYEDDAVIFANGSIPEAGAIVAISYAVRGDCVY